MYDLQEMLKRIKQQKKIKGYNNDDIARITGISKSTLSKILAGITKEPPVATIIKIAQALDTTVDYLVYGNKGNQHSYTQYETELINKYRNLDARGKSTVDNVIDFEYKQSQKRKIMSEYEIEASREIKLFDLAASAGTGNYLTDSDYTFIEARNDVPKSADFAIRISGDSMEPKYHDNQIVYVKQQQDLDSGNIGIFFLNGNSYIKRYEIHSDGYYLISLNPNYKPIKINDFDTFKCLGLVLN